MGTYSVHTALWSATVTGQDRGGGMPEDGERQRRKNLNHSLGVSPRNEDVRCLGSNPTNTPRQAQESESESHLISSTYIVDLSSLFLVSFYFLSIGQCVSWPTYVYVFTLHDMTT